MTDPLDGLAPKDAVPHFRSAQPLAAMKLGPEEGFVLSRVDGTTKLAELLQLVPFPPEQTVDILRRLWLSGAIEIPGHTPPVLLEQNTPKPAVSGSSVAIPKITITEVPAGVELTIEQAQLIDKMFADMQSMNAFEILGLQRGCEKKDVKRSYFKLSKDFHPDRYYGKKLGPYADRLGQIFQAVKAAFELLSDDERRAAYEESFFGG